MPGACPEGRRGWQVAWTCPQLHPYKLSFDLLSVLGVSCDISFEIRLPLLYEFEDHCSDAFCQILKYLFTSFPLKDELTGILKKLSLEKYQPIFEEQEVRMLFLNVHQILL